MSKPTYVSLCRQVGYFERAVEGYVFRGTIPRFESEEAAEAYEAVEEEYGRAKKALLLALRKLTDG